MSLRPTLALAMIVRNAADDLPRCLASVQPFVDEVLVGDTGSTDRSVELAQSMGARVLPVTWNHHFAEARNQVLDAVASDWVLVLDADERLDSFTAARIHSHLNSDWDGYQVTIRNYADRLDARLWDQPARPNDGLLPEAARFPAWLGHQNVRLFRRHSSIRFSGRVHESVGPSLRDQGLRLGNAEFLIHHLGFVMSPEVERRKSELYRELGKLKLQDAPGNAQSYFEVGIEELTRGKGAAESLGYFVQSCRINPAFALSWLFAAIALSQLGHDDQADEFLQQAESLGYRSPLLLDLRADLLYRKGEYAGASAGYRELLTQHGPAPEAESKLGMALWRGGDVQEGLRHLRHGLQAFPGVAANYDRLMTVLVAQQQTDAAIEVAVAKLRETPPRPENYLRLASLYAQLARWQDVQQTLFTGCRAFPQHADLRRAAQENGVSLPEMNEAEDSVQKK